MTSRPVPRCSQAAPPPSASCWGARLRRSLLLEPLWVLLLGPALLLPGRVVESIWHPLLVTALFLWWPVRWLAYRLEASASGREAGGGARPLLCPLASPLALTTLYLLACVPVGIWAAGDREEAWIAAGYLGFGIALYVALVNWPPASRRPESVAVLLLAITGGLAVLALPVVRWKAEFRLFHLPLYDWLESLPVDFGETIHANILASALVLGFPIALSLALHRGWTARGWLRLLCAGETVVLAAVIFLTQGRGVYLGTLAAVLVVMHLRWPSLRWLLLVYAGGGILLLWGADLRGLAADFSTGGVTGGWSGRLDTWQHSLQAIGDFPFTGIGLGNYLAVMDLLYPLRYTLEAYPHAHNLFLQVGLDLGIPGLIGSLALLLAVFALSIGLLRARLGARVESVLAVGSFGALIAHLVDGIFSTANWGTKLAFLPWLLLALIVLLHRRAVGGPPPGSERTTG